MTLVEIPKRLQRPELRFIKVLKKQKRAFETNWQNERNYRFDDEELITHLGGGGNYGVVGGFGTLVIIDCDTEAVLKEVETSLPETFTVKTTHGKHFYYICRDLKKPIRLFDQDKENIGDIQSTGKYVVGPNSIHPSGRKYEIEKDIDITPINAEQINFCLRKWLVTQTATHKQSMKKHKIDLELRVEDVIPMGGLKERGDEYQGPHPIHGSETGMNFTVNPSKNVWHCFRHCSGGNAFTWIAVEEGIIDCAEATSGCLDSDKFKRVLKVAVDKYGLKLNEIKQEQPPEIDNEGELRSQVLEALVNKKYGLASELLVVNFLRNNYVFSLRSDVSEEMWIYQDGIYTSDAKSYIQQYVREICRNAYKAPIARWVVDKIRADTFVNPKDFFEEEELDEVAVANGILNIRTRELMPFTPEKKFFNKLPVKYDPEAVCPAIEKHLKTVLKNEEDIFVIFELFGWLLLREYKPEKAFMFVGDGRNGKGKTLELMKYFIGPENCANIPIQQFEADTFAMGELHKKLANLGGDISATTLNETGHWKSLTGRDLVSAARKYLVRVHFVNYAKMVFCANELPRTNDKTVAFFERWVLLEFPYIFVSRDRLDRIAEPDKKRYKLKDPEIIKKLVIPEELSGLLNHALDGLDRLRQLKDFSYSKSMEDVKMMWIRRSDSFAAFLMDYIIESWDAQVTKESLRQNYALYCKKNKLKMMTEKVIKEVLTTTFAVSEKRPLDEDGERSAVWSGIKFKDNVLFERGVLASE